MYYLKVTSPFYGNKTYYLARGNTVTQNRNFAASWQSKICAKKCGTWFKNRYASQNMEVTIEEVV